MTHLSEEALKLVAGSVRASTRKNYKTKVALYEKFAEETGRLPWPSQAAHPESFTLTVIEFIAWADKEKKITTKDALRGYLTAIRQEGYSKNLVLPTKDDAGVVAGTQLLRRAVNAFNLRANPVKRARPISSDTLDFVVAKHLGPNGTWEKSEKSDIKTAAAAAAVIQYFTLRRTSQVVLNPSYVDDNDAFSQDNRPPLVWGDVTIAKDEHGDEYADVNMSWNKGKPGHQVDKPQRMYAIGPKHRLCPVQILKHYLKLRGKQVEPSDEVFCFKSKTDGLKPLDVNRYRKAYKELFSSVLNWSKEEEDRLHLKLTPHGLRRGCAQYLAAITNLGWIKDFVDWQSDAYRVYLTEDPELPTRIVREATSRFRS